MENKQWIELIESKKEEIIEKGMKAYRKAAECRYNDYAVTIDEDGDVDEYKYIHNSGSMTVGCYIGTQVEVIRFHFDEPLFDEVNEYELTQRLKEGVGDEVLIELKEKAFEESTSLECICCNTSNNTVYFIYKQLYLEDLGCYINEYAPDAIDEQIERTIENLNIVDDFE